MIFEEWNIALARFFFNPARAGKRVYLHTTKELLARLSDRNSGFHDFVAAIKNGPESYPRGGMCARALALSEDWRSRNEEFPPYVAYLCLFALAAGHDGDWPRHAYYPRLWDLLEQPTSGAPPQFRQMSAVLWRDLEVWSHSDKKGELGLFKCQSALDWFYVGVPIAQTILTEEERSALPELFERADLEPGSILPEGQLAALLVPVAEKRLRRRTIQLLASRDSSEYRTSLLEILESELSNWDGTVPKAAGDGESLERRAGLRVWLKEVDAAGFVTSRIVALLPDALEADELLLECPKLAGKYFECPSQSGRTTDALRELGSGTDLDAAGLPWEGRTEFRCAHTGTRLVFPASVLRIFGCGGSEIGGFIEVKKLPPLGEFFVAAHQSIGQEIAEWGGRWCKEWAEVRVSAGLPGGWRFFRGANATGDGGLGTRYPALARRTAPRITFEGGIRTGSRAAYFPFALPKVAVDWHEKPTSVRCNGDELQTGDDGLRYQLASGRVQAVNTIEVEVGPQSAQAMLFIVSDGWRWSEGDECPTVNCFGEASSAGSEVRIRGADVKGPGVPEFVPDAETIVDQNDCALLLGRAPGQIADLRRGDSLPAWQAIWAVTITRKTVRFVYCGNSIDASGPDTSIRAGSTKRWASVIWVNRKRTEPVKHPRIRALLNAYREVARAL